MKGKLVVISGPSGVGKSTVLKKVLEKHPNFHFSVSATTRPMRPGEQDGVSYFFVTREQFQKMVDDNALLEHAEYVGNCYGTPEAPIEEALREGKDMLLDVEPIGALNVKRRRPDAILIFMAAPSFAELKKRLVGRGDTAPELIEKRLERAKWEYTQAPQYDYIVVNDIVEKAAEEILSILAAEECKAQNRLEYLNLKEEE